MKAPRDAKSVAKHQPHPNVVLKKDEGAQKGHRQLELRLSRDLLK